MPANLDSGMFVRTPAWHNEGFVTDTPPADWAEARKLAGLEWEPIELPVFSGEPAVNAETGEVSYKYEELKGWKRVVRSDNSKTLYIAQNSYELITHADMGLIMESLLEQGSYHIDTAGAVHEGRKVWALLELGDPIQIKGDPSETRRYVAVLNSHDGMSSCKVVATTVRVVCANTWQAADYEAKQAGTFYSFNHSSGWRTKLDQIAEQARAAIKGAAESIERYRKLAEEMTAKPVSPAQANSFLDQFICEYKMEAKLTSRQLVNVNEARAGIKFAYESSDTCDGIRGTAYGLMQVGGEYADHLRPYKSVDTHVGRQLISNNGMKQRAKHLALRASSGLLAVH